jgi:hypothetical protein
VHNVLNTVAFTTFRPPSSHRHHHHHHHHHHDPFTSSALQLFLLLHFGAQGLQEAKPADSVSGYFLGLSPSLSQYFSFLLYRSSSAPSGLPLLRCPLAFEVTACFSMAEESFLSVRPIHFRISSFGFSNNTYLS